MIILLSVLAWVFFGLLAVGLYKRIPHYYVTRKDVLKLVCLSPVSIVCAIFSLINNSDWWDKRI